MSSSIDTSLQDVITIPEDEFGEDGKGEEEHQCGKWCRKIEEEQIGRMKNQVTVLKDGVYIRTSSPYSVPFALGWERFEYYYNSPCGIKLYDLRHVMKYLIKTKSKLSIKQFTFNNDFTYISIPLNQEDRIVCEDVSKGKEAIAVRCVNNHDDEIIDPNFEYVTKNIYPTGINSDPRSFRSSLRSSCSWEDERRKNIHPTGINSDPRSFRSSCSWEDECRKNIHPTGINSDPRSFRSSCSCEDECRNILDCQCRHLTDEAEDLGQLHGLLDSKYFAGYRGVEKELPRPYIFGLYECNPDCSCSNKCYNKVVQNGLKNQLEVFRTDDGRGWGVRCRHDLHSGDFVATYTGEIISYSQAEMRGTENDEYFTKMNLIEIVEEKEGFEESAKGISDLDDDETSKRVLEASSEETEPSESILSDVSCSSSSSEVEFVLTCDKRKEIIQKGTPQQEDRLGKKLCVEKLSAKKLSAKKLCVRKDVTSKSEWKDIDRFVPVRKYIAENTVLNSRSTPGQVTGTVSAQVKRSSQQGNVRKEGSSEENSMRTEAEEEERSWKAEGRSTKEEKERSWKAEEGSTKDELSAKSEDELAEGTDTPSQESVNDPLDSFRFLLDGKRKGNIGRFLNHSCRPNCFLQIVFTDTHDPRIYQLAFFTTQKIPAMTELTWNYLYQKEDKDKFVCLCEACKQDKQETNDLET